MTVYPSKSRENIRRAAAGLLRGHWKFFLVQGLFLMLLGFAAAALPQFSTFVIEIFVGWVLFIGGIFRLLTVLQDQRLPGFRGALVTAVAAIGLGLLFALWPKQGVLTLTLALSLFFMIEGGASIGTAFEYRRHMRHWVWMLVNGVVNLVLAAIIWFGWPQSADWLIGLLVGINLFFLGLALIMAAISARVADTPRDPARR